MAGSDLKNRKLFVPRMPTESARAFAAAFRSVGIDATITPESNLKTLEAGMKFTRGDECLPQKITMGDFLNVLNNGLKPDEVAFFMPTANGPCRFGQYAPLFDKTFKEQGYENVMIISPTNISGYNELGEHGNELIRTLWRSLVAVEILTKLLHKTRPVEREKGLTEKIYENNLLNVCSILEDRIDENKRMKKLVSAITAARDQFQKIPTRDGSDIPLIGIVGEIFCRLNTFSNQGIIKQIEREGGMVWISDVTEWVRYAMAERRYKLIHDGKKWSMEMLVHFLKNLFLERDEQTMTDPVKEDLVLMPEPKDFNEILDLGKKYLPFGKVSGEMVVSVGRVCYLQQEGVDGVIDVSPFTCMNGIVAEAIYPKLSREHNNIPIKTFYFDGIPLDLERDIGIFMELAKNYRNRRKNSKSLNFLSSSNV